MNIQPESILVLAPHTDDGELGCGASLAKWSEQGAAIHYLAFSAAEESVPAGFDRSVLRQEVLAATAQLGIDSDCVEVLNLPVRHFAEHRQTILQAMIDIRRQHTFDLVLAPAASDIHQDHQVVHQEAKRAFKQTSLLGYELVWNQLSFAPTCVHPVNQQHVQAKVEALQQYQSQQGRPYLSKAFHYGQATMRGVSIGVDYAEAFEVIRWRL